MRTVYTVDELAKLWNCSTWLIYKLCKNNELKHFKIGASIRILETDALEYIFKSRKQNSRGS